MKAIALKTKPYAACIVPEKRTERTTEGGLDVVAQHNVLAPVVAELVDAGIRVSLFIAPERRQIEAASRLRVPAIEIHVGAWCDALAEGRMADAEAEWRCIREGANLARGLSLEVHAVHGLNYETSETISALPEVVELNIGHFLVGEAIFVGLGESVRRMRVAMDQGRQALRRRAPKTRAGLA
jgi:pyridoxine 5-phosphate synthase